MTQYIRFPNSVTGNASVSQIGTPPPLYATFAGFIDPNTGFLTGLTLTASGGLPVSDLANGPVAPGAPAAKSELIGAMYNAVLPTLASGQQAALQADSSGRLLVSPGATVLAADGLANPTAAEYLTFGFVYNGATWDRVRGDTNGLFVQGNVASGVADAGNPIKAGGVFNTVLPTFANGERGDLQIDTNGRLITSPSSTVTAADGFANPTLPETLSFGMVYNGATWDRTRGDINGQFMQGNVASGVADAGNPIKAGGVFNTVLPTLTNAQRGDLQLDSSARLLIGALATGANTIGAVTQASGPWTMNLTQVGGAAVALGQTTMAASIPVTMASDQTAIAFSDAANGPVTPGAVASKSELIGLQFNTVLPTLANGQQAAAQADSSGRLLIGALATGANVIGAVTQSGGPWTQNLTQVGGAAIALGQTTMAASLPVVIASNQTNLPANITQVGGSALALGQTTMAASVPVTLASNQTPIATSQGGRSVVTTVRNDYTSTAVTTGAWVQLVASTGAATNLVEVFDSSGQTMELGTGAAAAETRLFIIFPGGNGPVQVAIPAATRVSIRAISATANTGELDINFYG